MPSLLTYTTNDDTRLLVPADACSRHKCISPHPLLKEDMAGEKRQKAWKHQRRVVGKKILFVNINGLCSREITFSDMKHINGWQR